MLFKFINMASQSPINDPRFGSPMTMISRQIGKWLTTVGLIFLVLGILVITYPDIFAVIAACFMFFIAGICLLIALKLMVSGRRAVPPQASNDPEAQYTHVEVSDVD